MGVTGVGRVTGAGRVVTGGCVTGAGRGVTIGRVTGAGRVVTGGCVTGVIGHPRFLFAQHHAFFSLLQDSRVKQLCVTGGRGVGSSTMGVTGVGRVTGAGLGFTIGCDSAAGCVVTIGRVTGAGRVVTGGCVTGAGRGVTIGRVTGAGCVVITFTGHCLGPEITPVASCLLIVSLAPNFLR